MVDIAVFGRREMETTYKYMKNILIYNYFIF